MRRMLAVLIVLFVLSGCAPSAGEAWFTPPKMPAYAFSDTQDMLCREWDFKCRQGMQDFCILYYQQCVAVPVKINALVLVNNNAPSSDVLIATDITMFLQNYNAVLNTKLDSEVSTKSLADYDLIARVLYDDVNFIVRPAAKDVASEVITRLKIKRPKLAISMVNMDYMTVRDFCRLVMKSDGFSSETVVETVLEPVGNGIYLGKLLMDGSALNFAVDTNAMLLRITLPDKTKQDITLDQNMQCVWNYQGKSWRVKVDIQNRKVTFTYP